MKKRTVLTSILTLALAACGAPTEDGTTPSTPDGGMGPTTTTTSSGDPVKDTLQSLGVDTTETPRVDENGMELPTDHSPLGQQRTINKFDEIVAFGIDVLGQARMPVVNLFPNAQNRFEAETVNTTTVDPWFGDDVVRTAARGDFDGDGQEEVAVVYFERADVVKLVIVQDSLQDFEASEAKVIGLDAVTSLFATSGDFDGDGRADLAIAMVGQDIEVIRVDNRAGSFDVETIQTWELVSEANQTQVILQSGNIDHDNPHELAVVINHFDNEQRPSEGRAQYAIFDDAARQMARLQEGPVLITLPTDAYAAAAADIAIGDVDRDGRDEIVLGGITEIGNACGLDAEYAVVVFDDLTKDLDVLATDVREWSATRNSCSSGASHRIEAFYVTLADIDGDGAKEIATNEFVYEDLAEARGRLEEIYAIPQSDLLNDASSGSQFRFHFTTSDVAAGDVTSDKRENIVFYTERSGSRSRVIQVWGIDGIDGWKKMHEMSADARRRDVGARPQLLIADMDPDSATMALEYSSGSHRLVFTEPVVMAALAAPPCARDLGQNLITSCTTAFGKGVSETTERTNGWSFTAGVSVGFETEFSPLGVKVGGFEAVLNTKNTLRNYTTNAYTLTKRVLRETGVLEDSVIFTTVPLDVYTYTILSHPNPELVGGQIQVRLPREPITVMTTRALYDASTEEDAPKVGGVLFKHSEGDPSSYVRASEKDARLEQYTGVESEQVDVGEGNGFTLVSITSLDQTTNGKSYKFEASLDIRATKGVVVGGISLGGGADVDFSITRGTETIYQGSVGNVAAEHFPQDAYSFGLYAYIYTDPRTKQTFEVLDYWVEP